MKRKVLASVLGAAGLLGLAASSYGQGQIIFDNYDITAYHPIVYSGGSQDGNLAGSDVQAELGYFIGTSTVASQFTLIPTSLTGVNAATPGYFQGAIQLIPNYTSGPVSFEILAWNGGGSLANATYSDASNPMIFTEPSVSSLPSPAGGFTALPGNIVMTQVTPVPEPTTLALAGLTGLASLVTFRRKQS